MGERRGEAGGRRRGGGGEEMREGMWEGRSKSGREIEVVGGKGECWEGRGGG